jgi:hypothetical protein
MMTLRIDDGYGSELTITLLSNEKTAIVDLKHADGMVDFYLDSADLFDLSRIALIAANELEQAKEPC